MLAKLCITCNLIGCKTVTSQTTTLNLANCICQQEFVDPKTEKSLPDSWSLSVYFILFSFVDYVNLLFGVALLWQNKYLCLCLSA